MSHTEDYYNEKEYFDREAEIVELKDEIKRLTGLIQTLLKVIDKDGVRD